MHTGKMVQSTVKYKVLASDVQDEIDNVCTDDEDDEITIDFHSPFIGQQRRTRKRDTCVRVTVAVILLGIVFGFMIYEWNGYWPGVEERQDLSNHQEANKTHKISEDEDHDHHQHHQDDGDHNDHDHNHKDGHDHDDHALDHHDHNHDSHTHEHSQSLYHNAAIITDSANCSSIGKELLQERGNVVDAGIAALLCLGVVHPHTAGLGGVFSAILYNHTTRSFKAIRDTSQQLSTYGAPSLLQGLQLLHSNYGHLEWSRLFEGATKVAKEGFLIDGILSRALETHKDKILQSGLCDLFCDAAGHVKSEGEHVTNRNLSDLLRSVSLNSSHFPENLAVKLAQDISEAERPAFLAAAQAGSGEINDPLIVAEEKYSILSPPYQLTGGMVSNILDRVREQNLTFPSHGDIGNAFASYNALLNLANEFFNTSQREIFTLNTTSSHVGVLDSHGNFIVISTSLNSTWGSGQYLPSSGVILNDFTSDITQEPYFSFPLVLNITEDGADDPVEKQFVAVTGGLSALLHSVVMLRNLADVGLSAYETASSPMLHIEQGGSGSLSGCISGVTNSSVVFRLLSEGDGPVREVGECSDCFLSMLLQLRAEHVRAYGVPATEVHADGY
ncbi:gamma-glutamyltransferase 6-like isoform X2 [Sinocyclocheilus grahami]|uniref:gamma-glutamyltransferase 6-like isoform X2 n=2 Tax=Sinocyclocheilus grahami TaxID=75366 RepID=UPI0007AD1B8E|nr:PREDICTED: gamma-glutamyltransferase 6-like isoform X2 [Sinocyclocheilus grahami]